MPQSSTPKLTCSQCGYENEPERVYCHNCGTKLDRSVLPKETVTQQESLEHARRRIKKLTNPGTAKATIKQLLNTLIYAALVAAVYLLITPPERVPNRESEAGANVIGSDIDAALESPAAATVRFSEADLSQHLRSRVKDGGGVPGLKLKRAYSLLGEGTITLGVEQTIFGYPLHSQLEYRIKNEAGRVTAEKSGMHVGRLGLHPAIPGTESSFKKIWDGLKRERALYERAQSIMIGQGRLVLITKPAPPAPR
jgi:hypothetical protein